MSQQDLLRRVVEALERAGVDYMLTGSFVSSLPGEPRATHDIDVVVAVDKAAVRTLVDAFPTPEFYLNEEAAYSAIATQGMFNLIAITEGDKVDFRGNLGNLALRAESGGHGSGQAQMDKGVGRKREALR